MDTRFKREQDFLYVDLRGSFALDAFMEFLEGIGEVDDQKIIMDITNLQNTEFSYDTRFELVIAAQKYLNATTKYAVVWPHKDVNTFIFSNLKGFGITIDIFPKLVKAKKWLQIPS